MSVTKDLELLKDDKQYYNGVGKKYLSNSDIGALLNDPASYGVKQEDNVNFAKGKLFHYMLIEPDKVETIPTISVGSRNTNKYKDAIANGDGSIILLDKEYNEIQSLVTAMKSNSHFSSHIYEMGNQYEVPSIKEICGMLWKGKTDILKSDLVVDLKSTSNIKDFKWSAKKYNYDSQA